MTARARGRAAVRAVLGVLAVSVLVAAGCSGSGESSPEAGDDGSRTTRTVELHPRDDDGEGEGSGREEPSPGSESRREGPSERGHGGGEDEGEGGDDRGGGDGDDGRAEDGGVPGTGGGSPGGGEHGGGEHGGGSGPQLELDDRGDLGVMAPALLLEDVPRAVVEIDTTPGETLSGQARGALADRLAEHGGKESVSLAEGGTVAERETWTVDDLRAAVSEHRDRWSSPDRAAVYVLALSGSLEGHECPEGRDDCVTVGLAFEATSFALFVDDIPDGALFGLTRGDFEEAVAVHELGHLFGLVNLTGHGTFHEDPDHPGHSPNPDSVMYWKIEQQGTLSELVEGGPPTRFDADDREEMDRIRQAS